MSLASKIINKQRSLPYELYFDDLDVTIQLYPLTVEQRNRVSPLLEKNKEAKAQALMILSAATDLDGNPIADNEKEALSLPENVVGLCVSVIQFLTQGTKHNVIDKIVDHYIASNNPDLSDDEKEALPEPLEEEQRPN